MRHVESANAPRFDEDRPGWAAGARSSTGSSSKEALGAQVPCHIRIEVDDRRYPPVVQECDPSFFHIFATYRLDEPLAPPLRLLEVANETNQGLKGVNVTVQPKGLSAAFGVEGFSSRPPSEEEILHLVTQVSRAAARFFGFLWWASQPMASA